MSIGTSPDELFERERPRLLGLAYRMVGSIAEAEDIVGEAWARWCEGAAQDLETPEAWLTTVTTRLAIDFLRSARHNRQGYIGPWLPEPVVRDPGPEDSAELADSLTLGFLTLLDRLEPVERAVFLMADVFSVPFAEIAAAVDKSPPACRQIASRARRKLADSRRAPRPVERRRVDELLIALWTGDMAAVLERLAPDVVCITDGGGERAAARRPVIGAGRVARFLVNLARRYHDRLTVTPVTVNGEPGIIGRVEGEVDFVMAFEMSFGTEETVSAVRLVRNPDKLRLVESGVDLM